MKCNSDIKLRRANDLMQEVAQIIRYKRPFLYVSCTDIIRRERAIGVRANTVVINEVKSVFADYVHNLRSSLDQAYWRIVNPYAQTEAERRKIQFPFCETPERLSAETKSRLADRVSQRFVEAIVALAPHAGPTGNTYLYQVHCLDMMDKHRFPVPVAERKVLQSAELKADVPDMPVFMENVIMSGAKVDVSWPLRSRQNIDMGVVVDPERWIFEREINISIDVVIPLGDSFVEIHELMARMMDTTDSAIQSLDNALSD